MYECCVTKDDVTDCVEIELQVLAVCDTDEQEYVVRRTYISLKILKPLKFTECFKMLSGLL